MARRSDSVRENVPGDVYVDSSCIDCDTCRWVAPSTFASAPDHAYVARQPPSEPDLHRALMAAVCCPTGSIGTSARRSLAKAVLSYPERIADDVHHCGFHDDSTFGAASYLVVREAGNILVDVPRFARTLVRRIEELGGIKWLFLTHRDDVGAHRRFRDHFGCDRVLHQADVGAGTRSVELVLDADDPVPLDDETVCIPVPGHTRGSTCLLLRDRYLFSGDHVCWSDERPGLHAFRDACWFDWQTQIRSMERLMAFDFEWVLPGHGRRCRLPLHRMREEVGRCVAAMRA